MNVSTERRDGVLLVGLDRPEKRNALDLTTVDELHGVLDEAARDEPAVLVLHSTTPGVFVAGADLVDAAIALAATIGERSWRALELTKLALRQHRPATTLFDVAAQALLFETDEKRERMTAFLDRKQK